MNEVKIAQYPVSDNHKSSFFFDGFVAEGIKNNNIYYLMTYQTGEITYKGQFYSSDEIRELGKNNNINDFDIKFGNEVDVLVDRFLIIVNANQKPLDLDLYIYYDFDDAIQGFEDFLNK